MKKKKSNLWEIPSTLEDFQKLLEKNQQENSSTSEKKEDQPEAMRTFEVSFVPHSRFKKGK